MEIKLIGWEARGFRCPDIDIDLRKNGHLPRVSLIQMPNGTGKTTTLELLKAALTGNAKDWSKEEIQSFKKNNSDVSTGVFTVDLLIDESELTFELILDFSKGVANYRTSYKKAGGVLRGWKPPSEIRRFLEDRFIRLFIFDGELAEKLIESNEHEAEEAIDALFQLYLFKEIGKKAKDKWERETKEKSGKTSRAKSRRKNKLERLEKHLSKIENAKSEAEQEKRALEVKADELKSKISNRIDKVDRLRDQQKEAKTREEKAEGKVRRLSRELLTTLRSPSNVHSSFSEAIESLKGSLDTLKLPANTTRQFFLELIKEEECICGNKLDDQSRQTIVEKSEDFLGAETSGFINSLKQDISKFIGGEPENSPSRARGIAKSLTEAMNERSEASGDLRAIRDELIQQGDKKIQDWETEERRCREEANKYKNLLETINESPSPESRNDPETFCLKAIRDQVEQAKDDVAEITDTLELRKQIDILDKTLKNAHNKAKLKLKKDIIQECRERLHNILSFNPVEVSGINGSLELKNQSGASVGQTLAVAYTFLTTLLGRGQHQFPLVVDSPANPIDNTVRSQVAKVIPELTDQFVAFTISSERVGFTNHLDSAADGDVRYLTLFRKNVNTAYLVGELPENDFQHSEDGVLVEGKEYFDQFDDQEVEDTV